jgi:hypothetical protein
MIGAHKPNVRHKHRVYVDIIVSAPMTRRDAAKGLQLVLDERLDLEKAPIWAYDNSPYINKLRVVEPNWNSICSTIRQSEG